MAGRKSVAQPVTSRQPPKGNGIEAPPPSTYAAQLVQHHAPDSRNKPGERATTFSQLLHAILHSDLEPESDADINYKVIRVVTEAGLDSIPADDPFASWDVLLSQAIDSVAVIETTLRRQPGLLLFQQPDQNSHHDKTPMAIWLFASLIKAASRPECGDLRPHVERLLASIVIAFESSLEYWTRSQTVIDTYRDAVDEILEIFGPNSTITVKHARGMTIKLPTVQSIMRFSKDANQATVVSSGSQVTLTGIRPAIVTSCVLLRAVTASVEGSQSALSGSMSVVSLLKWAQDAAIRLVSIVNHNRKGFDSIAGFEDCVHQTLNVIRDLYTSASTRDSSSSITILAESTICLLQSCSEQAFSAPMQGVLADTLKALLEGSLDLRDRNRISDKLSQVLQSSTDGFAGLSSDLASVVKSMLPSQPTQRTTGRPPPQAEASNDDVVMKDINDDDATVPLSNGKTHDDNYSLAQLSEQVQRILGKEGNRKDNSFAPHMKRSYERLSQSSQEHLWGLLAIMPCVMASSFYNGICDVCQGSQTLMKSVDTSSSGKEEWPYMDRSDDHQSQLGDALHQLSTAKSLTNSPRCRALAAMAIRRFILHCDLEPYLTLGPSALGEWCLRALNSSSRDLRLCAAGAIAAFLREGLPREIRDTNRRMVLEYYRSLADRASLGHTETMIHAWGQVVVVCGATERNLALLRLVDYLGHRNHFVCSLALLELEQAANARSTRPWELCKPFLNSLSVSAVRDLGTNPGKSYLLAEYLRMGLNNFLNVTQRYTVPVLVLTKNRDVLKRVAAARESGTSIKELILQPPVNLFGTLALLLSQPVDDPEEFAVAVLVDVVPEINEADVINFLKGQGVQIIVQLLRFAGQEETSRKAELHKTVKSVAVLCQTDGKSRMSQMTAKSIRSTLALFFETHILGIMTIFSENIEKQDEHASLPEKIQYLQGIEELINLAKADVSTAVPQIRACLQSAIDQSSVEDQKGLVDPAISAWLALMGHLDTDDIVPLLDHLFSIIVQHWSTMSMSVQQRTYDTVAELLKTHNATIRDEVITVPSLASIPLMSKFESEINRLKENERPERLLEAFVKRLQDENAAIVMQAAKELWDWLTANQTFVHEAAVTEPPLPVIGAVIRALLDACVKYNTTRSSIADSCCKCLGAIGCLDPNRIEATVSESQIIVLSNFEQEPEVINWVASLLVNVLVPAFRSATNARAQGFLAFVMQELCKFSGFEDIDTSRLRSSQSSAAFEAWLKMPENVRNTLIPFLSSRYWLTSSTEVKPMSKPIFRAAMKRDHWLRKWVYDMLWQGKGEYAGLLFPLLARVIQNHDISIARFLLPYVALHIVLLGSTKEVEQIEQEMMSVILVDSDSDNIRQCSEDCFAVLDYMTRWVQEKRVATASTRITLLRAGHTPDEAEELSATSQISKVEKVISSIPADRIAQRAIECGSFARALFHWENHIRERESRGFATTADRDEAYTRLQSIYSEIDEPDGLEGIAARISVLTPEQQAFQHLRAGRWSAAQSWYEIELDRRPFDHDLQVGLLTCLQSSGQSNQVIRMTKDILKESSLPQESAQRQQLLSFVSDAACATNNMNQVIETFGTRIDKPSTSHFKVAVGSILAQIDECRVDDAHQTMEELRSSIAKSLTAANASSLEACHNQMLQLHILYEVERLMEWQNTHVQEVERSRMSSILEKRLEVLGSFTADKQTILAIRRLVLGSSSVPPIAEIGKSWLTTAKLARKNDSTNVAHSAVLRADQCGDNSSKIEQARLMWKQGQHWQAIQRLDKEIQTNPVFSFSKNPDRSTSTSTRGTGSTSDHGQTNMLAARAHLLLAKWLDTSGQSQTVDLIARYQFAAYHHARWEKGHYYLGKHYNKLLEANLALPPAKRDETWANGQAYKVTAENFLRSIPFGCKYWHVTIPKLITLWLSLGMECHIKPKEISNEQFEQRKQNLMLLHKQLKKYISRVPKYAFYTALPQLISRISHPHAKVAEVLSETIGNVVAEYPAQALWALLPVVKATSAERANRGKEIIAKLRDSKRSKSDGASLELRGLILQGTRLQDGLLLASEVHIEGRASNVSLSRDLGFSHKLAPNGLVVPFQSLLTPHIPTAQDATALRNFKPFAHDKVTIGSFSDDVLVLNSLQRPRKLTLRGSDGKSYGLLCKPKDDLRKDQRLMEFNTMINRALKRNPEASKRHLYIKTYGVTPLSEESGTIEWVEGIKPLRDILLKLYQRKGIQPNYTELRELLNEASSHKDKHHIFTDKILPKFPPVLHEWFTELFPSPSSWFAARLRYTRSNAVMSMVGHVLGLGDRHGENILLEESNGGVFHVDFNCLFDKGLTFEKPELVPFRLTHNMLDAMGPDIGPYRKSAELVLALLRTNHDALMNVLETFLHDPTTDFIGQRKKKPSTTTNAVANSVPDSPQQILDFVSLKLKGYLRGESLPLSNEGLVQALINAATDEGNLCRMYIGWCAFL